jgi:hypothetical protein
MKKTLLNGMMAAGIVALFIAGCKKDDSGSGSTTSSTSSTSSTSTTSGSNAARVQLITNGSVKAWRKTAFETQDGPYEPDECTEDDRLNFSFNGTYTVTYGTELCDPEQQTDNGTWMLSQDGNKITITQGQHVQEANIRELTQSMMKLHYIADGDTITETYSHP